eukprot:TRINITY_DN66633_c0_g1_i1.p1 TRINITY_DN66633_c0_g1~~TRINITY_DN66633_c0_g1_i1.p1  ORF type:complete len:385 (-),score=46.74 TRINITY_DN66633_c0_g1_i1:212-1366(-)
MIPRTRETLEQWMVRLSFWGGAVGIASIKFITTLLRDSSLLRAAMFDSLGDVVSNAIMALTHQQVANVRNQHLYPVGKARLGPLGVLFFSAFICSSMLGIALDNLQKLLGPVEADQVDAAAVGAEQALRWLFRERPRLRWACGFGGADEAIRQYSVRQGNVTDVVAGGVYEMECPADTYVVYLLVACVGIKFVLAVLTRWARRWCDSEIMRALYNDHFNDVFAQSVIVPIMKLPALATKAGVADRWVRMIEPVCGILISFFILRSWAVTAVDQLALLSDRRTENTDVQAIGQAATRALRGTSLRVRGVDVYHAGEALRVRVDVQPSCTEHGASDELAFALADLEHAVREANPGVAVVDTQLRPAEFLARKGDNYAWVAEYSPKV